MQSESQPILTTDRNILVFWEDAKPNGLVIGQFNRILMVRVSVPGDNKSSAEYVVEEEFPADHPHPIHGKVKKNDPIYKRFGKYIEDYKSAGGAQIVSGTPIEEWPVVNRAQVAMLKHNGIHSVEALGGLSDNGIVALGMGGRKLVQQAQDYLTNAANSAAAMEAMERERATEARFSALEEKFNDLAYALESLPPEQKAQVKETLAKKGRRNAA